MDSDGMQVISIKINKELADVLSKIENFDDCIEECIRVFVIKKLNEKIERLSSEVRKFEERYKCTFEEFRIKRIAVEEQYQNYLEELDKINSTHDRDYNVWETYNQELKKWKMQIENLSNDYWTS